MRAIDKDELIETIKKSPVWTGLDVITRINAMPTIDYVPRDYYEKVVEELCRKHTEEIASMPSVVRCKECKYWLSDKPIKNKWFQNGEIDQCKWRTDESPNADDFCSYGERSE